MSKMIILPVAFAVSISLVALAPARGDQPAQTSSSAAGAPAPAADQSSSDLLRAGTSTSMAGRFGIGPMFGEPIGVTPKYWFTDRFALDGGVGYSFANANGCQLNADVLWHPFDLYRADEGTLMFYFGAGGRVKFVDAGDNLAGIRGPVGLSYLLGHNPIEVFVEVAPCLDFAPSTKLHWNGFIGFRYYFK